MKSPEHFTITFFILLKNSAISPNTYELLNRRWLKTDFFEPVHGCRFVARFSVYAKFYANIHKIRIMNMLA